MNILFQTTGVLTQYNWGLPYFIVNKDKNIKVLLCTNLFSYIMGGFYYHFKANKNMFPFFIGSGVIRKLDEVFERLFPLDFKGIDLLHLNNSKSLFTRRILNAKIPKVFTAHGSLDLKHIKNLSFVCKNLRKINENVNAFIAPSHYSAMTIKKHCGFRPFVIHHGVNSLLFNPFNITRQEARKKLAIPDSKKVMLWIGRIDPDKGLHTLIEALPHILKEYDKLILLIKGRTIHKQYFEKVRFLVKRLNVEKHIIFDLKWSPNITMPFYYHASNIYVHTSISEAFGSLTLLEAMASGIPIVANNASSIPEAVGDAGLLYEDSETDLSNKILKLVQSRELERKMGMKAFQRIVIEGFTLPDIAKKYLQLYERILKNQAS